ncbi:uncharacterized protein V6R79_018941 [Siganus canaliculatus]
MDEMEIYGNIERASDYAGERISLGKYSNDIYENSYQSCTVVADRPGPGHSGFNDRNKKSSCRGAAVALGLLCLVLLTGLIVLVYLYTKGSSDWKKEMLQLKTSYNNVTEEKQQLQTSYSNISKDRDEWQKKFEAMTKERDDLQTKLQDTKDWKMDIIQLNTSYNNVTEEIQQLLTSYSNIFKDRDEWQKKFEAMTKERDDLQKTLQVTGALRNLTVEKVKTVDKLRPLILKTTGTMKTALCHTPGSVKRNFFHKNVNYNFVSKQTNTKGSSDWKMEMLQLKTSYNNVTEEKQHLQTSYSNISKDRDEWQKKFEAMTKERDDLQTKLQDRHHTLLVKEIMISENSLSETEATNRKLVSGKCGLQSLQGLGTGVLGTLTVDKVKTVDKLRPLILKTAGTMKTALCHTSGSVKRKFLHENVILKNNK